MQSFMKKLTNIVAVTMLETSPLLKTIDNFILKKTILSEKWKTVLQTSW